MSRRRPEVHDPAVEDVPGLGLAERPMQVGGAERVIGVGVHGQPLAGIEQLDQQHRRGAVRGDVVRAEPSQRIGGDRVGEQSAVAQAAEPEPLLAGERGGRSDPVLGAEVRTLRGAAEAVDLRAAAVEALRRLVRIETDEAHVAHPTSGLRAGQARGSYRRGACVRATRSRSASSEPVTAPSARACTSTLPSAVASTGPGEHGEPGAVGGALAEQLVERLRRPRCGSCARRRRRCGRPRARHPRTPARATPRCCARTRRACAAGRCRARRTTRRCGPACRRAAGSAGR